MRVSRFISAVLFATLPVFNAFAVETTPMCPMRMPAEQLTGEYIYDRSCYDTGETTSACYDCGSSVNTNTYTGVTTTAIRVVEPTVVDTGMLNEDGKRIYNITCKCGPANQSYKCTSGFYGTAINMLSGCTKCPNHATCAGGNGSTFVCNSGYVKTDTACVKCSDGEWLNGTVCESCPTITNQNSNATSTATPHTPSGATSITQCYYLQTSLITDERGSYYFNDDCNYGAVE